MTPGDACRLEFTKWGGTAHWQMDAVYLGSDGFGDWLGFPRGTRMSRPGMEFTSSNDQVGLLPAEGSPLGRGWAATFHGPGGVVQTYVDMTTIPAWDDSVARAVDLDLDVVLPLEGPAYVDDEDEFAEHQVSLGYPLEIVELARASADLVLTAVQRRVPPFDGSHLTWLSQVTAP